MSDILSNDAAWRKLCHAALCEPDPKRLVQRIAAASSAVIDHIDSGFPNLSSAELALHDALDMLISLQDMANVTSAKANEFLLPNRLRIERQRRRNAMRQTCCSEVLRLWYCDLLRL